jgi:hypothetical protein
MNGRPVRHLRLNVRPAVLVLFLVFWLKADAAEVFQEISEHVYPFDRDGAISLRATDGSILLYGSERAEVSIKTIKKAYSQARLKDINVDVKATAWEMVIETAITPRKRGFGLTDRSGTVDYVIVVPQTTRVAKLELVNGELFIAGLRGGTLTAHLLNGLMSIYDCFESLDLTTVNGRVELVYNWWENKKFALKISNSQGQIRTRFPPDASIGVTAQTITGVIVNDLTEQDTPNEPARSLKFVTGSNPATTCEINSTDGNIRIEKVY